MSTSTDPASVAVETSLFRALAVYRAVVLVYAVGVNAVSWREFDVAWLGWSVLGGIAAWTLLITWVYDAPERRRAGWLTADLAVALLALLSTPIVQSDEMLDAADPTIPTFWVSASLLAWTAHWRVAGGLVPAVLISAADLTVRRAIDLGAVGNIFLLFMAALVLGYCVGMLRDAAVTRAQAERLAAAADERERLARNIHDGVLQVLALVQRRGTELGGPAADLGRLAGEQEVALRGLVQRAPDSGVPHDDDRELDLCALVEPFAGSRVTVSTPGDPVWLDATAARELAAAVRAALDNTATHAGPDAQAWVLVEEDAGEVIVSVRDDGPGVSQERLAEARQEGRMGVSRSIEGRMQSLGGSAVLTTGVGQGVEWELHLPN